MAAIAKKINLEKQTVEVPGTRKPGQTGNLLLRNEIIAVFFLSLH